MGTTVVATLQLRHHPERMSHAQEEPKVTRPPDRLLPAGGGELTEDAAEVGLTGFTDTNIVMAITSVDSSAAT